MAGILTVRLTGCQAKTDRVSTESGYRGLPMAEEDTRSASPVAHREGPATAKRAQVQADVLRATEGLLAEGASYAELNIERIATAAGISRTAFYFYFRDKRDLLIRLTEDVAGELFAQAEGWWHGEGDGREALRASLAAIFELYTEHDVLLRAVVETSAYDEPMAAAWREIVTRFVDA